MHQPIHPLVQDLMNAWNRHDIEGIASLYSPEYAGKDVGEADEQMGKGGIRDSVSRYLQAFPDITFEAEETVVNGDRVAVVWTAQGTHQGPLMNIPPTGRQITVRGMSFLTLNGGEIIGALYIWDVAGLLRSINLLPEL